MVQGLVTSRLGLAALGWVLSCGGGAEPATPAPQVHAQLTSQGIEVTSLRCAWERCQVESPDVGAFDLVIASDGQWEATRDLVSARKIERWLSAELGRGPARCVPETELDRLGVRCQFEDASEAWVSIDANGRPVVEVADDAATVAARRGPVDEAMLTATSLALEPVAPAASDADALDPEGDGALDEPGDPDGRADPRDPAAMTFRQ